MSISDDGGKRYKIAWVVFHPDRSQSRGDGILGGGETFWYPVEVEAVPAAAPDAETTPADERQWFTVGWASDVFSPVTQLDARLPHGLAHEIERICQRCGPGSWFVFGPKAGPPSISGKGDATITWKCTVDGKTESGTLGDMMTLGEARSLRDKLNAMPADVEWDMSLTPVADTPAAEPLYGIGMATADAPDGDWTDEVDTGLRFPKRLALEIANQITASVPTVICHVYDPSGSVNDPDIWVTDDGDDEAANENVREVMSRIAPDDSSNAPPFKASDRVRTSYFRGVESNSDNDPIMVVKDYARAWHSESGWMITAVGGGREVTCDAGFFRKVEDNTVDDDAPAVDDDAPDGDTPLPGADAFRLWPTPDTDEQDPAASAAMTISGPGERMARIIEAHKDDIESLCVTCDGETVTLKMTVSIAAAASVVSMACEGDNVEERIRKKIGGILGMAAKNDDQKTVELMKALVDVLDGKQTAACHGQADDIDRKFREFMGMF